MTDEQKGLYRPMLDVLAWIGYFVILCILALVGCTAILWVMEVIAR